MKKEPLRLLLIKKEIEVLKFLQRGRKEEESIYAEKKDLWREALKHFLFPIGKTSSSSMGNAFLYQRMKRMSHLAVLKALIAALPLPARERMTKDLLIVSQEKDSFQIVSLIYRVYKTVTGGPYCLTDKTKYITKLTRQDIDNQTLFNEIHAGINAFLRASADEQEKFQNELIGKKIRHKRTFWVFLQNQTRSNG